MRFSKMQANSFRIPKGDSVAAITAEEMRTVDRIAVEEVGLSLLQMMEHAGRNLARAAVSFDADRITVLAGSGGNGGGGLACARHLAARGRLGAVVLDRQPAAFDGAAATQLRLLDRMDVPIQVGELPASTETDLLVDALIGYGLTGAPRGTAADMIEAAMSAEVPRLSLDVPSGVDATTGDRPGVAIEPDLTLTLALPKTGLRDQPGGLLLGDLGIPAAVYEVASIPYSHPFGDEFVIDLTAINNELI
jgi:NAD(P)H-hydrate epimerase